ncbi:hypothetical protein LG298_07480 [Cytobacillus firmus]|uniref:hypothetical protein n=1 Tax=Cytobacillus firmus TaxID=1399 RepID=UPI00384CC58A
MERLEAILVELKEAIDNDSVFMFVNLMDELEEIQGTKFLSIVLERFAPVIQEGSMIFDFVMSCQEESQGGEE